MRNKRGNVFLGIWVGIFVWMMGIMFLPYLTDDVTTARSSSQLDCANTSITDGTKLDCLNVDLVVPYALWLFFSLAVGLITGAFK